MGQNYRQIRHNAAALGAFVRRKAEEAFEGDNFWHFGVRRLPVSAVVVMGRFKILRAAPPVESLDVPPRRVRDELIAVVRRAVAS